MEEHDAVLSIERLVQYLRVPKSTLCRVERDKPIPIHNVGTHWRFRKEAGDRWLDQSSREVLCP